MGLGPKTYSSFEDMDEVNETTEKAAENTSSEAAEETKEPAESESDEADQRLSKSELSKAFFNRVDSCDVIYRAQELEGDQRVTVAGYVDFDGNNTARMGVAIRSPKDIHNKRKAKTVAARRAIYTPDSVVALKCNTMIDASRELHQLMHNLKVNTELGLRANVQ